MQSSGGTEREGGRGLRERDGGSQCVGGWVGGGDWMKNAVTEERMWWRCQGFCYHHQMQQVKWGLGTDVCTHVIIDSTLKPLYMDLLCSNITLYTHYVVRDKCAQDTHTHTQALSPYLGGVDNHKDLLNGGGRSSLYQVLLYRHSDKWECHDGWEWGAEGPTTCRMKLKPQNEPHCWTELGCHLVWWTPWSCSGEDEWVNAFLLTAQNERRKSKRVRGKVRYTLPTQEDDTWQDSRLSSNTKSGLVFFVIDCALPCTTANNRMSTDILHSCTQLTTNTPSSIPDNPYILDICMESVISWISNGYLLPSCLAAYWAV